jgi:tetratricopeptide (TPR) repeat protein
VTVPHANPLRQRFLYLEKELHALYLKGDSAGYIRCCLQNVVSFRRFQKETVQLVRAIERLANAYYQLEEFFESADSLNDAMAVRERLGLKQTCDFARNLVELGNCLQHLGRDDEADEKYSNAVNIIGAIQVDDQRIWIVALVGLATLRIKQKRFKEAEECLFCASRISARECRPDDGSNILVLRSLGWLYFRWGKWRKVADCLRKATRIAVMTRNTESMNYVHCLLLLGELHVKFGRFEESQKNFASAVSIMRRIRPPNDHYLHTAKERLSGEEQRGCQAVKGKRGHSTFQKNPLVF